MLRGFAMARRRDHHGNARVKRVAAFSAHDGAVSGQYWLRLDRRLLCRPEPVHHPAEAKSRVIFGVQFVASRQVSRMNTWAAVAAIGAGSPSVFDEEETCSKNGCGVNGPGTRQNVRRARAEGRMHSRADQGSVSHRWRLNVSRLQESAAQRK